ncbi:MAG TPA: hypothetical protein VGL94_19250 [Ktedonobacteraceae bacterium]|jgi:hypothetical protein
MTSKPIIIREARTEDIPFLQVMIWEAILASPILLAHDGIEALQQMEEKNQLQCFFDSFIYGDYNCGGSG